MTAARTRIVTDSTADIPSDWIERLDIRVVPCYVNVGEHSFRDGVELTRDQFYRELAGYPVVPRTSGPPTGAFEAVFSELVGNGADVISLHPPAPLSGIYNSARLAASNLPPGRVHVIDTGQTSMGLGWPVVVAAELAAQGAPAADILTRLGAMLPKTVLYCALDTIEFLRHSGRVTWAHIGLSSLLQLKILIELYHGQVRLFERIRTRGRSLQRLAELARSLAPLERLAVMHSNAPEEAAALRDRLADLALGRDIPIVLATPALGTHVGPRAVAFAAIRA